MIEQVSRRLAAFVVVLLLLTTLLATGTRAQERVSPAQLGEIPTTGALRPGPIGSAPPVVRPRRVKGITPVAIRIQKVGIDAPIEQRGIVDGVMQDPTGPWVVAWYKEMGRLGEPNNVVLAGHLDYWDVGPAVFYNLNQLTKGDRIEVIGKDEKVYVYEVTWTRLYDTATAPVDKIVGRTKVESLTLITCGGPFDYERGEYLQRFIVRAERVA